MLSSSSAWASGALGPQVVPFGTTLEDQNVCFSPGRASAKTSACI